MKRSGGVNLKLLVWCSVALLLVALSVTVSAQRKARRGPNGGNLNRAGSARLRETALQTGYVSGVNEGRNDRSRREHFNFKDETDYKIAKKGYTSDLGDESLYQRYFRAGFENGYNDGWNGY